VTFVVLHPCLRRSCPLAVAQLRRCLITASTPFMRLSGATFWFLLPPSDRPRLSSSAPRLLGPSSFSSGRGTLFHRCRSVTLQLAYACDVSPRASDIQSGRLLMTIRLLDCLFALSRLQLLTWFHRSLVAGRSTLPSRLGGPLFLATSRREASSRNLCTIRPDACCSTNLFATASCCHAGHTWPSAVVATVRLR